MRINNQPATRATFPSAQTTNKETEQPMNIENANFRLQITMLCIETHMVQVGAWEQLGRLKEDTGGHARGQATNGVHPDIYYRSCPPSYVLSLDPQKGIRDPHRGPIGSLR